MTIIAIDPGNEMSAWVVYEPGLAKPILQHGYGKNSDLLCGLLHKESRGTLCIEMIACYGMPVGKTVFETCLWVGRYIQAWQPRPVQLVYRRDIKLHLCNSARAKDGNVRQALIDLLGPVGTKKNPGACYGIKGDQWAALGVAVYSAAQSDGKP